MNKKSTICFYCSHKTDHRIKHKGHVTCPNCLEKLHGNKEYNHKYRIWEDSANYKSGEIIKYNDELVKIK